jgi:DNA-binding protein H-NS
MKRGDSLMARPVDYDAKIAAVAEKLEKKQQEVKKLKEELAAWKDKKSKANYKELLNYMSENDISAEQALDALKK